MALGIDIGYSSIKIIQTERRNKETALIAAVSAAYSGSQITEVSEEKDVADLVAFLKKMLKDANITSTEVNLAISDEKVFSRVIKFPLLTDQEIAQAVKWEAEQYVPIPLDEAVYEHMVVERNEKATPPEVAVMLMAVSEKYVSKLVEVFNLLGMQVSVIESTLLSVVRTLPTTLDPNQSILVLDLGAINSSVGVVREGKLYLARSLKLGGVTMTRAVAQAFNLPEKRAEEYKKAYGLDSSLLEGKVAACITPVISALADEIKKTLAFFQEEYNRNLPTQLYLSGGGALTTGLPQALAEMTGLETITHDPLFTISLSPEAQKAVDTTRGLYATAAGLALREEE